MLHPEFLSRRLWKNHSHNSINVAKASLKVGLDGPGIDLPRLDINSKLITLIRLKSGGDTMCESYSELNSYLQIQISSNSHSPFEHIHICVDVFVLRSWRNKGSEFPGREYDLQVSWPLQKMWASHILAGKTISLTSLEDCHKSLILVTMLRNKTKV